jgi:hypothetical protein
MKYAIFMEDGNFFLSATLREGFVRCLPIDVDRPTLDPRTQVEVSPEYLPLLDSVVESWRSYDKPMMQVQTEQVQAIKQEASNTILAKYPLWKQNNLLAEMSASLVARGDAPWSEAQTARVAELAAVWQEVRAIRSASNDRETAILAAETGEQICQILDAPHPGDGPYQWNFETSAWELVS